MDTEGNRPEGQRITQNVWLCPDGVYRWTYEFPMLRNPVILFTVWKVLGIAFGAVYLFTLILSLAEGSVRSLADLWEASRLFVILAGVFFVLSVVSYLILAAVYGWKYQVLFEMTEDRVTHIQMPRQFKKAQAIGWIALFAGLAAGRPSVAGLGLNTAAGDAKTSVFRDAERVTVRRKVNTIHVDQVLDKNQVYAEDADFEFVERFILARCTKAKIRGADRP